MPALSPQPPATWPSQTALDRASAAVLALVAAATLATVRDDGPGLAALWSVASGLVGLAVVWGAARYAGGAFAGLAALILLALCPLYYGSMLAGPGQTWEQELFRGRVVSLSDLPHAYVPVLLWLKLPEIFIALALAGLAVALAGAARKDEAPRRRAALLLIALAATLPIMVAVLARPALPHGIRSVLFVLLPLAVAGGLAAGWVHDRIGHGSRRLRAAAVGALLLGLMPPFTTMVGLHPYPHAAFNELAGGVRGARPFYTLDGPGLSLKEAAQMLVADLAFRGETPPDGRQWRVAVCGPLAQAEAGLDARFAPTPDPRRADFALTLGEFYCAGLDAPQIARVEREGVTFARVYDLRGRKVESLLMPLP